MSFHVMSFHVMSFHVRSCRSFHACVHVFHCSHVIQVFHHKFIHVIYSFMSVHAMDIIVCNFMNFLLWYFMFCNIHIYMYIYNCVILCITSFHVIGFEFSSLQFMSFMSFNVLSFQFIKVHAMTFIHSCHSSIALHCLSLHFMSCVHSLNIFVSFVCLFIHYFIPIIIYSVLFIEHFMHNSNHLMQLAIIYTLIQSLILSHMLFVSLIYTILP